jgi:hypothetical protein
MDLQACIDLIEKVSLLQLRMETFWFKTNIIFGDLKYFEYCAFPHFRIIIFDQI